MPYIYKSGLQFGITEQNIYGGADYVELTQAEYDALSYAEKHNGQVYFITDGNYDFLIVNDSVPIGSIQAYGGVTAPDNWLICDGSAVSRIEYSELFQVIGITYGEGNGETTFNLPDLKGKVTIGANTNYTLGASGGEVTNYIIKATNPKVTSGQQTRVADLLYPVGSYYETSDEEFDPNVTWGGTWVNETDEVYTAAWTATSTNSNNARVTDSLVLPPGIYIASIKCPVASQTTLAFDIYPFGTSAGAMFIGQGVTTMILTVNETTTVYAESAMSNATTYTYTERGYLKAVRISSNNNGKWHRIA